MNKKKRALVLICPGNALGVAAASLVLACTAARDPPPPLVGVGIPPPAATVPVAELAAPLLPPEADGATTSPGRTLSKSPPAEAEPPGAGQPPDPLAAVAPVPLFEPVFLTAGDLHEPNPASGSRQSVDAALACIEEGAAPVQDAVATPPPDGSGRGFEGVDALARPGPCPASSAPAAAPLPDYAAGGTEPREDVTDLKLDLHRDEENGILGVFWSGGTGIGLKWVLDL